MRGQDREGEKCRQGRTRQDPCRAESETGCEDAEGRGGEQGIDPFVSLSFSDVSLGGV